MLSDDDIQELEIGFSKFLQQNKISLEREVLKKIQKLFD